MPGLETFYPLINHENGLQTTLLGLKFMVKPGDLFHGGAITLRCTATVSQTYSTSSEELIVGERFMDTSSPMNTLSKEIVFTVINHLFYKINISVFFSKNNNQFLKQKIYLSSYKLFVKSCKEKKYNNSDREQKTCQRKSIKNKQVVQGRFFSV